MLSCVEQSLMAACALWQVGEKKLKDTKGGYAQFLRENQGEAKVMEDKEKRVKVLEQSTVKAKSKVCCLSCALTHALLIDALLRLLVTSVCDSLCEVQRQELSHWSEGRVGKLAIS